MKNKEREKILCELWLKRPEDKRTGTHVLFFHAEILNTMPDLLHSTRHGDSYQQLMVMLRDHRYVREPL